MVKKKKTAQQEATIGWREWLCLPELQIESIKAKVDTGARSSALHAFDVRIDEKHGLAQVFFKVHPLQHDSKHTVVCRALLHDQRWVKSSNGKREYRPVIRTTVAFAGQQWPIDLTLTSRDVMGFRMLLGREAIRQRFLVDPGRSFYGDPSARMKRRK